ncbi:MAG: hypothetical protein L6R39_007227 [Caloplaca ligustica]|nr:MAG: hypothetical protein L6R39_007227 [Caloplaca ligustica]
MRAKPATLPTTLPTIVGVGAVSPLPELAAAVVEDDDGAPAVPVGPPIPPATPLPRLVLDAIAEDGLEEVVADDENDDVVEDERLLVAEVELLDAVLEAEVEEINGIRNALNDEETVVELEAEVIVIGTAVAPEVDREEAAASNPCQRFPKELRL